MLIPESVIAGTSFVLFSVLGTAAQLYKIERRIAIQRRGGDYQRGFAITTAERATAST